jgi:hypothetical protein
MDIRSLEHFQTSFLMNKKTLVLRLFLAAGILLSPLCPADAQVLLALLDPDTNTSSVTVSPGDTFSLVYRVSGLTSPALNNFDTQLSALPDEVTLTSFTSDLPAGWIPTQNLGTLGFGGVNFFGSDITGTDDLVLASFAVSGLATPGAYQISFTAPGAFMALRGPGNVDIPFTASSASLSIVPEPSTIWLLFGSLALAGFRRPRKRAPGFDGRLKV